jgi:hypothetical protein
MPLVESIAPAGAALPEAQLTTGAEAPGPSTDQADYLLVLVRNPTDGVEVFRAEKCTNYKYLIWR